MALINCTKKDIKVLICNLLKKYLSKKDSNSQDLYNLYSKLLGKTKYEKEAKKNNWPLFNNLKFNVYNVYNFLSSNDKRVFVDLYFRYNDGLFFDPNMEYFLFKKTNFKKIITKSFLKKISQKHDIKEYFLVNFFKKILKIKILSDSAERLMKNKIVFKNILKEKLNNGFIYIDESKKYIANKKGEIFKINKNIWKINKIKHNHRSNNTGSNYLSVFIHSKEIYLHRFIAEKFIPNPNNYRYVRAIDDNPINISVDNLEWVKYPAATRVIKNINKKNNTWLNFIINNFIDGIEITPLCEIISEIARDKNFFPHNHNKARTVYMTIEKYSQSNKLFPIFNIHKGDRNLVFINNSVFNKYRKESR